MKDLGLADVTAAHHLAQASAPGARHCEPGAPDRLLDPEQASSLADLFKALSDPTRVRLLKHLADSDGGTVCACHLPEALGITQPTLSFHLHKLHAVGLVTREQRGRWAHWSVNVAALEPVRGFLALETALEPAPH